MCAQCYRTKPDGSRKEPIVIRPDERRVSEGGPVIPPPSKTANDWPSKAGQ